MTAPIPRPPAQRPVQLWVETISIVFAWPRLGRLVCPSPASGSPVEAIRRHVLDRLGDQTRLGETCVEYSKQSGWIRINGGVYKFTVTRESAS